MLERACVLGAMVAAVLTGTAPARAGECAPAQIKGDPAALPLPWRHALEALAAATAREGQPWSCPGGHVALVPPGDRGFAELEVEDGAGVRRRAVASPEDVVPLGEAMLARAVVPPTPADNPSAPPPPLATPPFPPPPPPPVLAGEGDLPGAPRHHDHAQQGHRVLVDALVGVRYTGPTRAVLMGPELRATLAYDRWSAALLARYDASIAIFQRVPPQFTMSSATLGLAAGYRLLARPVELVADVEPTLALVFMGAERPGMPEPDVDAHVDMRLGARLAAALPIYGRLRAVAALGAEGAPAALFCDRHSRRHVLPELPGYLAGISLGFELTAIQ